MLESNLKMPLKLKEERSLHAPLIIDHSYYHNIASDVYGWLMWTEDKASQFNYNIIYSKENQE